jgi:hypothetical protein
MPEPHGHYPARRLDLPAFASGKTTLGVMSAAFTIFGLSLLFQSSRWASTPAYHVLLQILSARTWGWLFLVSGVSMGVACWQFQRRWLLIACLTLAFALTNGWMLAFVIRYLTSPNTTPETWVSWGVFDYLLTRVALSVDFVIRVPAVPAVLPGPLPDEPGPMAIAEARAASRAPPEG